MSKVNRCVLIALLLVMVHFLLFLYGLLSSNNNSDATIPTVTEDVPTEESEEYVIKDKQLELGDLSVFEVTVDGEVVLRMAGIVVDHRGGDIAETLLFLLFGEEGVEV